MKVNGHDFEAVASDVNNLISLNLDGKTVATLHPSDKYDPDTRMLFATEERGAPDFVLSKIEVGEYLQVVMGERISGNSAS